MRPRRPLVVACLLCLAATAFARSAEHVVPGQRLFAELGPGALGFWEDSLFSLQLKRAGYRFAFAADAIVEHHFDADRLSRSSFLDRAAKEGRSRAYIAHHWEHRTLSSPRKEAASPRPTRSSVSATRAG